MRTPLHIPWGSSVVTITVDRYRFATSTPWLFNKNNRSASNWAPP